MDLAGDSARWALVLALILSTAEKLGRWRSGSASWHPVMLARRGLRPLATPLMIGSMLADVAVVATLLLHSALGALLFSVLCCIYTIAAWPAFSSPPQEGCRCFWLILDAHTRLAFAVRNILLLLLAAIATQATTRHVLAPVVGALCLVALSVIVHGIDGLASLEGRGLEGTVNRTRRRERI